MGKVLKSKEFFRQVRAEQVELWALEQKYQEDYNDLCLIPSGIDYSREKVQVSPRDSMTERIAVLDGLRQEIKEQARILNKRKAEALAIINNLQDSNQRAVMELYYLSIKPIGNKRLKSWEDVAYEMGYTVRNIRHIHGSALLNLEKYFT